MPPVAFGRSLLALLASIAREARSAARRLRPPLAHDARVARLRYCACRSPPSAAPCLRCSRHPLATLALSLAAFGCLSLAAPLALSLIAFDCMSLAARSHCRSSPSASPSSCCSHCSLARLALPLATFGRSLLAMLASLARDTAPVSHRLQLLLAFVDLTARLRRSRCRSPPSAAPGSRCSRCSLGALHLLLAAFGCSASALPSLSFAAWPLCA